MSPNESPGLAHLLFFTLNEQTELARDEFIDACHKHLAGHEGTTHFSVGSRGLDYARPVNDAEFDVAVVLVFDDEASHDRYQASDRHQKFLAENGEKWSRVRVFDALV